jgi:hypothetical protein
MGFTVQDLLPDITSADGLGTCDTAQVHSGLTDALRLLEAKAQFDFSLGTLDISVCASCVTLPKFVGTVLAVGTCAGVNYLRDQWYQFHINGVGPTNWTDCGYTDELGEVVTFRDLTAPCRLVAVVENSADNNREIRVFGTDVNGRPIWTNGPLNQSQEGFLVPTINGYPLSNPNAPLVARIDRISLQLPRQGFIRLVAIDPSNTDETTNKTLVGYYDPTEKYPTYRRIRLARNTGWARIKYRKAYKEIRSNSDWIDCDNKLAIKLACQAVRMYNQRRYDEALAAEGQAARMLSEDQSVKQTPTPLGPQIITNVYANNDRILTGGWDGYGGYY